MKQRALLTFGILLLFSTICWQRGLAASDPPASAPTSDVEVRGSVRVIRLPELESDLPDLPGRKTVMIACNVCHSTRYIMNQPPLSREAWTADVTKMRKTYGAPIADDKAAEIVDYLV